MNTTHTHWREWTADDGTRYRYTDLAGFLTGERPANLGPLPFSLRVLLESVLRRVGQPEFTLAQAQALACWTPATAGDDELPFLPGRVLLQDFTGVPCVVDLAALRSALARRGGDPQRAEPLLPVNLIIDHSVQLDEAGSAGAYDTNLLKEFERNRERYTFLRWGRQAFKRLEVLPPGLGICHQVNMEYLGRCVWSEPLADGVQLAYPDTLVGTDSHTVMINSMGILGWGVGGIEAEAAMLGLPIPMLPPPVTGVRLSGRLPVGATSTDLALAVTETLRAAGVVGHFVEFCGPALAELEVVDRAPVANMAPEYGATCGFFPVDEATLRYLRETGRTPAQVALVEAICRAQDLWRDPAAPEPAFTRLIEIDLATVRPCVAGPRRPQERVPLDEVAARFTRSLSAPVAAGGFGVPPESAAAAADGTPPLAHGAVVIASITSCTNTSHPDLMLGAALLARKARARGLQVAPGVKTSFAPGSRVVTRYLERAGLLADLAALGFDVAAYGCATCIGNSGPLPPAVESAVREQNLVVAAVLSGNRNFEGRIHALTRANYLCSPLLVVAYALAGNVRRDLTREPLGHDAQGQPVLLADIWPTPAELAAARQAALRAADYPEAYDPAAQANPIWDALPNPDGALFPWEPDSTYIREPPFFSDLPAEPAPGTDFDGLRVLGFFGDFVTTDHISPAGQIAAGSPAAAYLQAQGFAPPLFNSYGSRRGNHEVMLRGTFANIRLRNRLADREGGWTRLAPGGEELPIYEAAQRQAATHTPLLILAGKMYGAGSSRDWAAKGTALLGVKVVLAESFERIHRSNLVEMGVLPLAFAEGQTADTLGLTGFETYRVTGLSEPYVPRRAAQVSARNADGREICFEALIRIDTPLEWNIYRHGGLLPYVLRKFEE